MKLNGKEIFVEESGAGPAIVMVHGLGGTTNVWTPQLGALASGFRVLRLDLEGAGLTPAVGQISIQSLSDDIVALMDKLEIKRAHLLGHSMGTIVCQCIAAQNSDRVESMALVGPLIEPPEPARPALRDRAAAARSTGMVPIADAIVQAATSKYTKAKNPAAAAFVRELLMRQDAEGYARNCEALAEATAVDLTNVTCPTLLMTGDEDAVAPAATMEALSKNIDGSKTLLLNDCGHWHTIEQPGAVTEALVSFLRRDG